VTEFFSVNLSQSAFRLSRCARPLKCIKQSQCLDTTSQKNRYQITPTAATAMWMHAPHTRWWRLYLYLLQWHQCVCVLALLMMVHVLITVPMPIYQ